MRIAFFSVFLAASPAFASGPLTVTLFGESRRSAPEQAAMEAEALADAHQRCETLLGGVVSAKALSAAPAASDDGAFSVISTVECTAPAPAERYFEHVIGAFNASWSRDTGAAFGEVARLAQDVFEAMGPDALPLIAAARSAANPALQETFDDAARWIRERAGLPAEVSAVERGFTLEIAARTDAVALELCQRLLGAASQSERVAPDAPYRCAAAGSAATYAARFAALMTPALATSRDKADRIVYFAAKDGLRQAGDAAASLILALAASPDDIVAGDALLLLGDLPTKTPAVVHQFAAALTVDSDNILAAAEGAARGFARVKSPEINAALLAVLNYGSFERKLSAVSIIADAKVSGADLRDALLRLAESATEQELSELVLLPEALAAARAER